LLLANHHMDVFVSPELYDYMIQSLGHSSSRLEAAKLLHPFHPKNDSCILLVKKVIQYDKTGTTQQLQDSLHGVGEKVE
jgi:hypothetical protein